MTGTRQLAIKIVGDAKGAVDAIKSVGDEGGILEGKLGKLGAAVGAAVSVAAVTGFAASSVGAFQKVGGESKSMARLMGDSIEQASALRGAFQLVGLNADQAESGMKKFSKAIEGGNDADTKALERLEAKNAGLQANYDKLAALKNPTDAQKDAMGKLREEMNQNVDSMDSLNVNLSKYGIQTKNADGSTKSMHDLLLQTATVFKNMPDGIEKNALAMKLFGKSGTDLLPILNKGAAGIDEL